MGNRDLIFANFLHKFENVKPIFLTCHIKPHPSPNYRDKTWVVHMLCQGVHNNSVYVIHATISVFI